MQNQLLLQRLVFYTLLKFGFGYMPTSHDLELLSQVAKQSGFQTIAYGLTKSSLEGKLAALNFVPFFNTVSTCSSALSQMPTPEQYRLSLTLLAGAFSTTGAVTFTDNADLNVTAGIFLAQIAIWLHDHSGVSFATMYKPMAIKGICSMPAIYFIALMYSLTLFGSVLFLVVNIFKYCKTTIKIRKFEKN
jgi:hypothetical protein